MSATATPTLAAKPLLILVDIEGTTTPIEFVSDVLFPFASAGVEAHLETTWETPETQEAVRAYLREMASDATCAQAEDAATAFAASGSDITLDRTWLPVLCARVKAQTAANVKAAPLKALQGHIWRTGYASGALHGAVFSDVAPAFEAWRRVGIRVGVYSSGSVAAQRLLFGYSSAGDLLPHLSHHFDTVNAGGKTERSSYERIATAWRDEPAAAEENEASSAADTNSSSSRSSSERAEPRTPDRILFLTDVPAEAYAAEAAGFDVRISVRTGNKPLTAADETHFASRLIRSFDCLRW